MFNTFLGDKQLFADKCAPLVKQSSIYIHQWNTIGVL